MRGIEREPMRTHLLYIMCHVFGTGPVACFASAHFMSTIRVYSHDLDLTRTGKGSGSSRMMLLRVDEFE